MDKQEIENPLKQMYKNYIDDVLEDAKSDKYKIDEQNTVRLYHGTNTKRINGILQHGILPRKEHKISNWKDQPSFEGLTYLTDKWHYYYAIASIQSFMDGDKYYGEIFPCYIAVDVPKNILVPDEDFMIGSKLIKNRLIKSMRTGKEFKATAQECLAHYGTVAVLGAVKPKWIDSFTILGDKPFFAMNLLNEKSQYYKDIRKWQEGKGKGKLKTRDLLEIEAQTDLNGTWWLKQLPEGALIQEVRQNKDNGKIQIKIMYN